ncbi:MAG: hypothetical protein ACLTG4_02875 [Oscillospiraceae bacterium]
MKHLKKAFCLLLAAVMLLALGVPAMAAGEIPVDAEHFPDQALRTYVTDYCDTNKDNKLSAAECEAVQCIDLFDEDHKGRRHDRYRALHKPARLLVRQPDHGARPERHGQLEKLDVSGCSKLQSLKLAGCSALHAA